MTPVKRIYDAFFNLITDDLYLEMTKEETERDAKAFLLSSLPLYEFPEAPLDLIEDEENGDYIQANLALEEVNILATGMVQKWLERQIYTIELTRQKFSGSDFKLSSQASHLAKLMAALTMTKNEHRRLQMLRTRRRVNKDGKYESAFDLFVKPMR